MSDDLRTFVADLGRAMGTAVTETTAVLSKGALNIKVDMQADARESQHFRQVGPSITYDVSASLRGALTAEIGPDRDRSPAGSLAGAYYGWPNGGGASLDPDGPLDREVPRFEKALADMLGGLL